MRALIVIALVLAGCRSRREGGDTAAGAAPPAPTTAADAGASDTGAIDAGAPWPPLDGLPSTEPVRVIALPARPDVPRFDVGGPVIVGDVAVISSSQLGFAAIDWRRGTLAWTKPAGLHVAPPIVKDGSAILIGSCLSPPDVDDTLLGCLRVVTAAGAEQNYAAIHGKDVAEFAATPGPQTVWPDGERTVRWRRGERAVIVDTITGVARPARAEPPALRVAYRTRAWDVSHDDGRIVAREARERGKLAWQTQRTYTALLGAVYLADMAPMVRAINIGAYADRARMYVFDIDATGSLHGQVAAPVPAIGLLGHAIDAVGNTAIAVRMDSSLHHDFIAGYAANALLMYVYALPEVARADPVGVAIAEDAVLVFHDGDTFTVLPELSAPPTSPGTPQPPSRNPTP
jgi:hypothetical protein